MNSPEQLLRDTLRDYARQAPSIREMSPAPGRSRRHVVAPIAGVVVAGVMIGGFVWLDSAATPTSEPAPASSPDVTSLVGEDVGVALGLDPVIGRDLNGCDVFAEYASDAGFCLDGVAEDPVERQLLALQIYGYLRDEKLVEYAELRAELNELLETPPQGQVTQEYADQVDALMEPMRELRPELTRP